MLTVLGEVVCRDCLGSWEVSEVKTRLSQKFYKSIRFLLLDSAVGRHTFNLSDICRAFLFKLSGDESDDKLKRIGHSLSRSLDVQW